MLIFDTHFYFSNSFPICYKRG